MTQEKTDFSFTKYWLDAAAAQQEFLALAGPANAAFRRTWAAHLAVQDIWLRSLSGGLLFLGGGWLPVQDRDCDETPSQAAMHPELIAA